jgi:glutathione S-transferase
MSYKVIGSVRSPFVRICRLFLLQNQIPFEFEILNFLENETDAQKLATETPVNKVPVLVDGAQKIFDSRVIINYLIKKHGLPALTIDEENYVTAIYSCLDTGVLLFLLKRDGIDIQAPGFFRARNRERIPANLKYLEAWASKLDPAKDWSYPAMALFSFLYWGEKREVLSLEDYPNMKAFLTRFQPAAGVTETGF